VKRSWSKSGRLLASGSDDCHVNITTYQSESTTTPFKLATTISTGHTANIFSVKFMPHSNDRTVISAAGDSEIRIFDIEYAGHVNTSSEPTSRRAQGFLNSGVQYLSEADTNCRVYRSHSDRVKRIVTESSPFLFLSCSEDGEVRQWDLRLPSSAYPRPAGSRRWRTSDDSSTEAPPALISYKKWQVDLNSISCSGSQPYYIALGGSHLHCFLHDRRMLGRDLIAERGGTPSTSGYSEHDDDQMSAATQCVKRFAPHGRDEMKGSDNGHITACKISDANPNEMVVSWSGDWIYSFDLLRSPDAREEQERQVEERQKANKLKQARSEKRKRLVKPDSPARREGSDRGSSRARTAETDDGGDAVELRVRYENGQTENIPVRDDLERPVTAGIQSVASQSSSSAHEELNDQATNIAGRLLDIKETIFGIQPDERRSSSVLDDAERFSAVLDRADTLLNDMTTFHKSWRYPVDPDEVDVQCQTKMRTQRESGIRFVQAAGTLSTLLGGNLPRDRQQNMSRFSQVRPAPNEHAMEEQQEQFSYDFLKAIILWLSSGPGALVEGFSRSPRRSVANERLPVPAGSSIDAITEIILPYLRDLAGTDPIYNLNTSVFEIDTNRKLFDSEQAGVQAFGTALMVPFADLSGGAMDSTSDAEKSASQSRRDAIQHWGYEIGRSLLWNASTALQIATMDLAFGGQAKAGTHIMRRERVLRKRFENINTDEDDPEVAGMSVGHVHTSMSEQSDESEEDADEDEDEDEDEEMIPIEDMILSTYDEDDDEDMDDDDGDEDDDDDDDDDSNGDSDSDSRDNPSHRLFHSAAERRALRARLNSNVPCGPHTRIYKGHCNVKTVKDVNFFGLQDEYVVSGSDDGNLFIWDRASGKLVNILEGDGEVVNVVQGHPYEPVLAVSGIDHTIKIFGPDRRARRNARMGVGVASVNAGGFSSVRRGMMGRPQQAAAPQQRQSTTADVDSDDTDTEPAHATHGLGSRKRMDREQEITSRNDQERQGGNRDAFITRSMLAQLTQRMRGRGAAAGGGGGGGEEATFMVNGAPVVVNTGDCEIM
jgi:nuclear receptor interaction protein